jgi:hypothetical protein
MKLLAGGRSIEVAASRCADDARPLCRFGRPAMRRRHLSGGLPSYI